MSFEGNESRVETPADKLSSKFVEKIVAATTVEELMSAFDKTATAAEMLDIDPESVLYRHPNGGSIPVYQLKSVADQYLKAAISVNGSLMLYLSDYGLPEEFKNKAVELAAAQV